MYHICTVYKSNQQSAVHVQLHSSITTHSLANCNYKYWMKPWRYFHFNQKLYLLKQIKNRWIFKHFTIIRIKLWRALLPDKFISAKLVYFDISTALGLVSMVLPCLHAAFSVLSSFPHHLSSSLNPTQQPRQQAYNKMRYFCLDVIILKGCGTTIRMNAETPLFTEPPLMPWFVYSSRVTRLFHASWVKAL